MPAPLVDIVYVNHNNTRLLEESLSSLRRVYPRLIDRITVVDSGSRLEETGHLAHLPADLDVVRSEKNLGFARAANLGARRGNAPNILFLNPDMVLLPNTVTGLLRELAARDGRALVGPRQFADEACIFTISPLRPASMFGDVADLLYERGWLREASLSWLGHRARILDRVSPAEVRVLSGAALAVGRRTFEELAGFDEAYFLYSEDADLCRRAARHGIPSVYLPGVPVVHWTERGTHGSNSMADAPPNVGRARLLTSHHGPLARTTGQPSRGGVACLPALRKRRLAAETASLDTELALPVDDAGSRWAVEFGRSPLFDNCLTAFPEGERFQLPAGLRERLLPGIYYTRIAVQEERGGWRERKLLRLTKVELAIHRPTLVQGVVA